MKFWDKETKTALILLRFDSATNNEQEKQQLVVFFLFPPFVFRSFSEEETLLERRAIPAVLPLHFKLPRTVQGFIWGQRNLLPKVWRSSWTISVTNNCTGMTLEIPKGKLLSITSKSATLNSVNISQRNQVLDFSYIYSTARTEWGIQSI